MSIADLRSKVSAWREANPRAAARQGIQRCEDLERILALPEREAFEHAEILIRELTEALKTPWGKQTLFPGQAVALYEIAENNGALIPLRVGGGKTLVTLLAPRMFDSARPLLLLPKNLIEKTEKELIEYAKNWRVATNVRLVSYEKLSRINSATLLEDYRPDLLMCDEAHALRNTRNAVTRRVRRYVTSSMPRFVGLSATFIQRKLADWAHLADWALKERSPAPRKASTVYSWGTVLDEKSTGKAGALSAFGEDPRAGYAIRVARTPGIVTSRDASLDVPLYFVRYRIDLPASLRNALATLESDWTLPDGYIITDPLEHARAMRQLELGCYYRWIERPPVEWLETRLDWSRFVRQTIRYSHALDSELAVRQAAHLGRVDDSAYLAWETVKGSFRPVTECVWLDDGPIRSIVDTLRAAPMVCLVHHTHIGARFEQYGIPYFGAGGKRDGISIEAERGDRSVIASIESNRQGRNLQQWSTFLLAELIPNASRLEQLIGRFHRTGQTRPVHGIINVSTPQAEETWERAKAHAEWLAVAQQQPQKLLEGIEL